MKLTIALLAILALLGVVTLVVFRVLLLLQDMAELLDFLISGTQTKEKQ